MKIFNNFSETLLTPSLIEVEKNVIMTSFQLMKMIPAKYVIDKALSTGKIDPKVPIIETSSGTFALSLGIVCAEYGLPFIIIGDPAIDPALQRRLTDLGGEVQIFSPSIDAPNVQVLRLNALNEYLNENKKAFWPSQYNNPDICDAYQDFAELLLSHIDEDFTLVATVGTGGSTYGTIKYLRKRNPAIRLVGVDTFGSVLFGLAPHKRMLRGLGNSIMPKNVRHDVFDEVHWVSAEDAFAYTRYLHSKKGIYSGPTTGAAYQVAQWLAKQYSHRPVVFISADTGHRYQESIYNPVWLTEHGLNKQELITEPTQVNKPNDAKAGWAFFDWARRPYETII